MKILKLLTYSAFIFMCNAIIAQSDCPTVTIYHTNSDNVNVPLVVHPNTPPVNPPDPDGYEGTKMVAMVHGLAAMKILGPKEDNISETFTK